MNTTPEGIIVLGTPRSGSTLLRRLLDAHPSIACPAETCLFTACARFLHAETVADALDFGVLTGLTYAGFSEDDVLARLREFAFTFKREHAAQQGKPRWAEKTAVDAFHLDRIALLCGEQVQYICLVRHGLDVACSINDLSERGYTYLSELHEYIRRYPRPLEAFAHAWVDVNRRLLDFVRDMPDNTLLVRYEDLVSAPQETLSLIFAFLGEDPHGVLPEQALQDRHDAGLGDWKTYDRNNIDERSIGRWRSLPPAIISRLGEICNPLLTACGYPPVDVRPPEDSAMTRRRYRYALMLGNGGKTRNGS